MNMFYAFPEEATNINYEEIQFNQDKNSSR